jgi:endonuclease/exonuclease/phosphatase family metal-dependent hydrolase
MRLIEQSSVRVTTLNLWGIRDDWPVRLPALQAGSAETSPELVTLQEIIRTNHYDQARDILGNGYRLIHQCERESDRKGLPRPARGRRVTRTLTRRLRTLKAL